MRHLLPPRQAASGDGGLAHDLIPMFLRPHVPLPPGSVDVVVTSPPYWKKRDHGVKGQLGQEGNPEAYARAPADCLAEWRRALAAHGSVFLNVGDTYHRRSLANVPALVELEAARAGWKIRNRVVWAKTRGMPDPVRDRLTSRHE
ncbi:DNA methyltransferase [Streptomyces sp. NPDC085659]|uniref:DNA methyltransferase n=1 Tax=Streptomyces sp. NPDC085659 TaxID=3155177 RepID=UPI00344CF97E